MTTTAGLRIERTISVKQKLKTRTVLLNALAEMFASVIFSVLYFIFISRYLDEGFSTDYIMLSFSVGLAFFAAIYIPFHTYRIHIIPFITLITSLRRKNLPMLLHKVPAQFVGAFIGVMVFNAVNNNTTKVSISELQLLYLEDTNLLIFINAAAASLLCYGFYMIRVLFKAKQLIGTIYLSLFYVVLFASTSFFAKISALNPFGYLVYDLLGEQSVLKEPILFTLMHHLVIPILGVLLIFYYIKPKLLSYKK